MINLDALEENIVNQENEGKPLLISLDLISEDPLQPRTEFNDIELKELADSIELKGVKQPISVKEDNSKPGHYIINFGARRYRASKIAGKTNIPVFIDNTSDDYDQVIENEQRANLTLMDLALFIEKKIKTGVKKREVAKMLSKPDAAITEALSLIDAPDCILDAYRQGKTTSGKTIYELRNLYKKFPEEVEVFCENEEFITRANVKHLAFNLKNPQQANDKFVVDDSSSNDTFESIALEADKNEKDFIESEESDIEVTELPYHNSDLEKDTKEPKIADPNKIKKPLLLVEYDGREAMVLLNKRPDAAGLIWIKYEDGSGEDIVDVSKIKINLLTEATI